eukprot:gene10192-18865_t
MGLPAKLTEDEQALLEKYALLKKLRKELQQKQAAIAAENQKATSTTKKEGADVARAPIDAKELAKRKILSGELKIRKDAGQREFKRARSINDKRQGEKSRLDDVESNDIKIDQDRKQTKGAGRGVYDNQLFVLKFAGLIENQFADDMIEIQFADDIIENQFADDIIENQFADDIIENQFADDIIENQFADDIIENQFADDIIENQFADDIIENQFADDIIENQFADDIIENQFADDIIENQFADDIIENQFADDIIENHFVSAGRLKESSPVERPDHGRPRYVDKGRKKIFVSGYDLTEAILQNSFTKFGTIVNVHAELDRGQGFITFASHEAAEKAIAEMHGEMVQNVTLKVCMAGKPHRSDGSFERRPSDAWRDGAECDSQDRRPLPPSRPSKESLHGESFSAPYDDSRNKNDRQMVQYDDEFSF